MIGLIYKATNRDNGKFYIGQTTKSLEDRKYSHERKSKAGARGCRCFYNAIRKHGFDTFEWEIICQGQASTKTILKEYLNIVEPILIAYHNTQVPNGYNIEPGGESCPVSEETRKKISKAMLGDKNPNFGRTGDKHPMFGKTGAKSPLFGKKRPEQSKRMSRESNPMFGKKRSEHSIRMSGESNPMFGTTGEDAPNWKGDNVTAQALRKRKRKEAQRNI